jgi:hypothetical protein
MNDITFSVTENNYWVTRKFNARRGESKAMLQYAVKSFVPDYLCNIFHSKVFPCN